jgi:hypothetical protein
MNTMVIEDPIERLSRRERRVWVRSERRVRREHEAFQLAALKDMAQTGGVVTRMLDGGEAGTNLTGSVEMIIQGRRLRAGRVYRPALGAMKEALGSIASVPLTAVSRYGPYWVLTFKLATEPLVLLADRLTLLPEWGGTGAWLGGSPAPAALLA